MLSGMRCLAVAIVLAGCASTAPPSEEPRVPHACAGAARTIDVRVETVAFDDATKNVAIESDCCHGVMLIDGEVVAMFRETGRTTLGVATGKHRFAIETDGSSRWERDIDVLS